MFGRTFQCASTTVKTGTLLSYVRVCIMLLAAVVILSGCGGSVEESLWKQIETLDTQKGELENQNRRLWQENEQLTKQVAALEGMDSVERSTALDLLVRIDISSRSGLFDRDNNGSKETLVVYVEPTDRAQDTVKAPGRIDLSLWNLDPARPQGALIKEWTIMPDQLQRLWAEVLMTKSYRLSFPIEDILNGDEQNLTVKVLFTDIITGKVFQAQQAVR